MDTIEHPLTGEKIRIAKADFSELMIYEHALTAINTLGSGWRLPTKEELEEMYKNKDAIGGFVYNDVYGHWSSNEDVYGLGPETFWTLRFRDGVWCPDHICHWNHVRAVRSI